MKESLISRDGVVLPWGVGAAWRIGKIRRHIRRLLLAARGMVPTPRGYVASTPAWAGSEAARSMGVAYEHIHDSTTLRRGEPRPLDGRSHWAFLDYAEIAIPETFVAHSPVGVYWGQVGWLSLRITYCWATCVSSSVSRLRNTVFLMLPKISLLSIRLRGLPFWLVRARTTISTGCMMCSRDSAFYSCQEYRLIAIM